MATLQWAISDPNEEGLPYLQFDIAEIWRSTNSNMSGAVKVAEAYTAWCDTSVRLGVLKYYQVRARDRSGQFGAFSPIVVSRDNSEVFISPAGSGLASYLVTKVGMVFQWGVATTNANGAAIANLNTTTARMALRAIHGTMSFDDGYPGQSLFTGWEGGRNPLHASTTEVLPEGYVSSITFYCRRIQTANKFGSQPVINLDHLAEATAFGHPVPDSAAGLLVQWVAIGTRVN